MESFSSRGLKGMLITKNLVLFHYIITSHKFEYLSLERCIQTCKIYLFLFSRRCMYIHGIRFISRMDSASYYIWWCKYFSLWEIWKSNKVFYLECSIHSHRKYCVTKGRHLGKYANCATRSYSVNYHYDVCCPRCALVFESLYWSTNVTSCANRFSNFGIEELGIQSFSFSTLYLIRLLVSIISFWFIHSIIKN